MLFLLGWQQRGVGCCPGCAWVLQESSDPRAQWCGSAGVTAAPAQILTHRPATQQLLALPLSQGN